MLILTVNKKTALNTDKVISFSCNMDVVKKGLEWYIKASCYGETYFIEKVGECENSSEGRDRVEPIALAKFQEFIEKINKENGGNKEC